MFFSNITGCEIQIGVKDSLYAAHYIYKFISSLAEKECVFITKTG